MVRTYGRTGKHNRGTESHYKQISSNTSEICLEQSMEQRIRQQPIVTCPCPRRSTRKRCKMENLDEESDEFEQTFPSLGALHCHRQSKSREICTNRIIQQQYKLNSNIFEHYLQTLWTGFSEDKRNSFAYVDCLWFSLYAKESSKAKVLKWIKRKDIFSKKYVLIPIIQWSHWSLLILCHFGESLQSKTRTPCMLLLDSLKMTDPKRLEPSIRKFVFDVYRAEEKLERIKLISKIPLLVPKVPQQRNGDECGKFVLYYINLFVENAPENFSIFEGYPYFMNEAWFTSEGFECFCGILDAISGRQNGMIID